MTTRLSIDELTHQDQRRFTVQQKAEAVALCLQERLSCNAEAQRLGLPSSSLARWERQARSIGTD
jgi:transposase-like protein